MEQIPASPGGSFSHITSHSETLQSGRGMARHVYTNASEKCSQNVDSKLWSNPMLFEG